jgi:hypothetical protein
MPSQTRPREATPMTRVTVSFPDADIYPQLWDTRSEAEQYARTMAELYPPAKIVGEDLSESGP